MRVVNYANRYNNRWIVLAERNGAERVVYESPSVFAALDWVRRAEAEGIRRAQEAAERAAEQKRKDLETMMGFI